MMHFSAEFEDELERTQSLPVVIAACQQEDPSPRERAARIEIAELKRRNLQQANEIARLRNELAREASIDLEARLFEVCGGLKDALAEVLNECRARSFSLKCGTGAREVLDNFCDQLEQILSAPESAAHQGFNIDPTRTPISWFLHAQHGH